MKVKEGFIVRNVADSYVVVAVGEAAKSFKGIVHLNKVGAFLWKMLENDCDEDELVCSVLENYDVDEASARADVKEFIKKMQNAGFVD